MGSVAIKPLVPARISLPERGAGFDLAAWLPEPIKSEYRTPALIRQRDVPRAPRSRVHAHDWPAVVRRYDDSRMVLLAREEEVPRDGFGRIPRNGAMAVAKDADFDRAICARKPSNALERPSGLAGLLLPHGSQVCEKQLGRHVDLAVDLEDLQDFYHVCGVTYEHALTTPIGPPLKASVLEGTAALAEARAREAAAGASTRGPARDVWQPCASSLPMRHLRAVEWAQLAHSNFLRTHGGLQDEEVLLYRSAVPRSSTWDGVMLDDRVVLREVVRGSGPGVSTQADAAEQAYPSVGLSTKKSKRQRGVTEVEFWGAHVHGAVGAVRVNDSGLLRPVGATLALCELGTSTSGEVPWGSGRTRFSTAGADTA